MAKTSKFQLSLGNVHYSVDITERAYGLYDVKVNDELFKINIADLLSPSLQAAGTAGGAGGASGAPAAGNLCAAMPGTVMTVKCKPGDEVKPGDVLLTLETMKMENPIKSNRAGKVKEIKVSPGKFVNVGETLIVFE
ncbi:MAG: acetyl-CoA carboxylase biotin carboxyl carrier protein subunit [Candidatus Methanosuratus sp.]|nr:acetyl-CoA carboxylase biotin carboxyl carrier protein subunit [Candidatus Methanosuratincola sp.]